MITAAKLLELEKLGIKIKPVIDKIPGLSYMNIYRRIKAGKALNENEIVKITQHFDKIFKIIKED